MLVALVALALCAVGDAFYLPGVAPQDYQRDDIVTMKVAKLDSTRTQLPFEFYSLPFCRPPTVKHAVENLGEVLRGDRIENSLYTLEMRFDEQCKVVCKLDSLSQDESTQFAEKIKDEYRVMMILDNLPVAMVRMLQNEDGETIKTYERGFPVGFVAKINKDDNTWIPPDVDDANAETKTFLNNHVRFTILYHKDVEYETSRIVGFEAEPFSVKHTYEKPYSSSKPVLETCNPGRMKYVTYDDPPQEVRAGEEIIFTYDVLFTPSDIKWASRWDTYLLMTDTQIHWFSIVNSMMIVLFLSGMVGLIMLRTLRRDITKYNSLETPEEQAEEAGWKLVHGDVFRPPTNAGVLCVLVGTGAQVGCMFTITLIFALAGFLSPANRGGLMTASVILYVAMGFVNGYVSGRLYKQVKGTDWRWNTLCAAFAFPSVIFVVFAALNTMIWGQRSSGAVPFGTFFLLIFLWFGVSAPLVFLGSYLGTKAPVSEDPVRTNKIPRQVPKQVWYMANFWQIAVGGVLPFGAIFIELFFILTSLWLHQFYYIFGCLGIVFTILCITCAEISVMLTYFQLVAEDHRWWWRSFFTSGSSALYLFAYGCHYFSTKLEVTNKISTAMFFGYLTIGSSLFFTLTGAVGFIASFAFVRIIYGSVKLD